MASLQAVVEDAPLDCFIEITLDMSGYQDWLRSQEEGEKRLETLEAFRALAQRSEAERLPDFLDEISLASDLDTGLGAEGLALSTVHAAKGLEWPVVFVAGLEEELLPHARALDDLETEGPALDEDLRRCYVAVTRAAERLYLTYTRQRAHNGRTLAAEPSRFLRRVPVELLECRAA